jgi:hypothetical protein
MRNKVTIITGASSNHFMCLQSLLWTISVFEPTARVIVLDLGLTAAESSALTDVPPFYLANWELRKYAFENYPDHFRMENNAGRMAFRPISVQSAAKEFGGIVIWLDAGCQLSARIDELEWIIKQTGVYCPTTQCTIAEKLYPSAHAPLSVTDDLLPLQLRDAGVCGFDTQNPQAMALIDRWAAVALDARCTAPDGSTRFNHRQDAVFAVLLNQAAAANGWTLRDRKMIDISMKRDFITLTETKHRLNRR